MRFPRAALFAIAVLGPGALPRPGTAAAPVRLSFVSVPNLAVGTPVQTEIDAEEHTGVILVPAVALVHEGEETAVFVAVANKAQRRVVEVGVTEKGRQILRSLDEHVDRMPKAMLGHLGPKNLEQLGQLLEHVMAELGAFP